MTETFGRYNDSIEQIDVKGDKVPDGFNENQIKEKAKNYVEKRLQEGISKEDYDKLLKNIKELLERQDIERKDFIQELKQKEIGETRESVDKEAMIQEAKTMIYEKLGINENQAQNSRTENFLKGIVDVLVIDNYDLAIEIYNTNGKVIIEALKALMSWEGIKQIAKALGESVMNLFTGNAYEKGKAVGELGLVGTGIGVTAVVGRKALKVGIKEVARLRVNKESLVNSPEIKGVISDTNKKVNEVIPKKQVDFNKMLVEDIAKLGDKERLEAGSFYLQRKLNPEQEKAIIKAHEVGKERQGAGVYNYNQTEISEKGRILKEAGFSVEERRLLMKKGVCGKNIETKYNTLYEDPKYSFLNTSQYQELRDALGPIGYNDIVGEGRNGLILIHPDNGKVIKIAREGKVDKLELEFSNHTEFRKGLLRLQKEFEGKSGYEFVSKFDIPMINKFNHTTGIYEMQRVNGLSIKTLTMIDYHRDSLKDLPKDFFRGMTDNQVEILMRERGLKVYPNNISDMETLWGNFSDREFMIDLERLGDTSLKTDIDPMIKLLKERGYRHNDEHWGNFMRTPEGKIFIIDFGRSTIPKK